MRTPRKRCKSEIYHVISRGTGKQLIFESDDDREMFLDLLEKYAKEQSVDVLAWCLMGNHVHMLLHAPLPQISLFMKHLCGRYAERFNRQHGRIGHLFQERFKSETVEDEPHLIVVVSYIHFNPEKAGMAPFDEYQWSSYGEYVGRVGARRICATGPTISLFGGIEAFTAYHEGHAAESSCMDIGSGRRARRPATDEAAIAIASEILGCLRLNDLKALDREARDSHLRKLYGAGLSTRQLERLTGISRSSVMRAVR